MNPKRIVELLGRLAMLKYFPAGNESVLEGLLILVGRMCQNEQQVEWLVNCMTSGIYAEWPGPQEMRACYCSRFKPADGINAYSQVYPDGLPPSRDAKLLDGPKLQALPPGKTASADDGAEAAIHIASQIKKLTGMGGPATPEEIQSAPEWLRKLEGY